MSVLLTLLTRKRYLLLGIALVVLVAFVPWVTGRAQNGPQVQPVSAPVVKEANLPQPGGAEQTAPAQEVVKVGVYILSIGNLDTTTGTYDADFYLNFQCATMPCDPSGFDIMNASDVNSIDPQTSDEARAQGKLLFRVRASFRTNLNLRDFPFDQHNLDIVLEDKNKEEKIFKYVIDEKASGIDPGAVVAGWQHAGTISGNVDTHEYPMFPPYSRARFTFLIFHPWFASFMKGLFAAIVIVLVGMLSFVMSHDATTDRLALTSSTLVGAILYHLTLTSSIPPVGYLTFADSFMMMNYVFVSLALGISVALMLLVENKKEEYAIRLHKQTRLIVPISWLVASIALTLFQFVLVIK